MESGRRRNTTTTRAKTAMVSVTAAGSVGEKRMKNDRVKGGINGDEINSSPDDGQEPRLKPRNAAAGKRKAVKNTVAENKSRSLAHKTCIDAADSCCDCNDNDNDDGNIKGDDGGSSSSSSADQGSSNTTRGGSSSSSADQSSGNTRRGDSPRPVGLKKTRSDSLTCGSTVSSKCSQLRKLKSEPNRASLIVSDPSTGNNQTEDLTISNNEAHGSSNSSSTTGTAAVLSESCNNKKMLEFNPLGMRVTLNKLNDHQHPIDPTGHRPVELEKKQTQEEEQVDVCKEIGVCHDKGDLITTDRVRVDAPAKDEEINIDVAETSISVSPIETEIKRPVVTQTSSPPPLHKSLRKGSSIASNAIGSRKRMPFLNKPSLNPLSSSPPQAQGKVSDEDCTRPEIGTHSRLQSVVDLVMWRDVSRSAFVFGIGTFLIISSSFAKDLDISLITVASYSSLVYLAIVFLYRSIPCRGIIEDQVHPQINVFGEEEALWLVKLVLPYLNEFLFKIRELFSGDPGVTMKLALMLFVLAKWGSSITIWKITKLGFFGAFLIPKLCSSYSTQITAYGKFWVRRFQDAWHSCSQKKAVAIAICTLVWNFSSVVARVWAAFMLYVGFRYYQQYLAANDWVEDQSGLHDLQQKYTTRQRHKVLSQAFEKKEKKSL